MLRSIIVDDELKSRESLKDMLQVFCEGVEVLRLCKDVSEGLDAIEKLQPEIVFLDVRLRGETGFELLEQAKNTDFEVIFITAFSEYALSAIKFSAIDYLLKPVHGEELSAAVNKVRNRLNRDRSTQIKQLLENSKTSNPELYKLALPTDEGLIFIQVNTISYLKALRGYTEIFTMDGSKHLVTRHLKEYEEMLALHNFFRIHHSTLVNLNCVKSYVRGDGGFIVMNNDVSLEISRRKRDAFLERIGYKG
ncbi:MAG: LytTR family DNA-binding domain-containing protein [Chryseolinea sp.]